MSNPSSKYAVSGFDLSRVRNRNEHRVVQCMNEIIIGLGVPPMSEQQIFDVYAYALNQLPARYAQTGTIVLRDPVKKKDIMRIVAVALDHVRNNPKK